MTWTKDVTATVAIAAGTLDKRISFYYQDGQPFVDMTGRDVDGNPFRLEAPLATLAPESAAQLIGVNNMACDLLLAAHGYTP